GYKKEFLQLNGFGFESVDYNHPVDIDYLMNLKP
ncbi:TPA: hypothetical protein ACHK1M_003921, partial [Escherichia coli]